MVCEGVYFLPVLQEQTRLKVSIKVSMDFMINVLLMHFPASA